MIDQFEQRLLRIANSFGLNGSLKCTSLHKYKNSVWLVENEDRVKAVVKFGVSDSRTQKGQSEWLEHEYAALQWVNTRQITSCHVLGYGTDLPNSDLTTWIAFEYIEGITARDSCVEASQAISVADRIFTKLGKLHRLSVENFPQPPQYKDLHTLETILVLTGYPNIAHSIIGSLLTMPTFYLPCHGDMSFNNVLVSPHNELELVDWGLSRLNNPMLDLAPIFIWLSLWQDISGAHQMLTQCFETYKKVDAHLFDSFHVFLARSALIRAEWLGANWAMIAETLLAIPDPWLAVTKLFDMVRKYELFNERESLI